MAFPIETIFKTVSLEPLKALRGSPINPWLVMAAEKTHVI
jgi:hypothetical protein